MQGCTVIDKFRPDLMEALDVVRSGASIAIGGFGSSGRPDALINGLCDLDRRDLHVIVNNVGHDFTGVGRLVMEGRVRRVTASFPILQEFYDAYFAGKIDFGIQNERIDFVDAVRGVTLRVLVCARNG